MSLPLCISAPVKFCCCLSPAVCPGGRNEWLPARDSVGWQLSVGLPPAVVSKPLPRGDHGLGMLGNPALRLRHPGPCLPSLAFLLLGSFPSMSQQWEKENQVESRQMLLPGPGCTAVTTEPRWRAGESEMLVR